MNEKSAPTQVDLSTAKQAFSTFFKVEDGKVQKPDSTSSNPAKKVLQQVEKNNTPPDKTILKVDGSGAASPTSAQSLSVDEANQELNREVTFEEILSQSKLKLSELFEIIDMFLEKGFYEEEYKIKSLTFGFRTKKVHSISTISDAMDGANLVSQISGNQLLMERTLAATLVYFKQGKNPARVFNHDSQEDDEAVLTFVKKELSSPIYAIMLKKLMAFDMKVAISTRDEAIERFLAHTQG